MIEVEKKFFVSSFDAIRQQLGAADLTVLDAGESQTQSDEYFNHYQLRFELQDIALRIREVNGDHVLTFKGPNHSAETKIRSEIEISLEADDAAKMSQVFLGLGMHSVAKVSKNRETVELKWQDSQVKVCLDTVAEVGNFVEIEMVVPGDAEVPAAIEKLDALASRLGLSQSTTTSYLEMLLQGRSAQS